MVVGARKVRSEKLREHHYREEYVRSSEGKGVEWDRDNNVEHMWGQVKLDFEKMDKMEHVMCLRIVVSF